MIAHPLRFSVLSPITHYFANTPEMQFLAIFAPVFFIFASLHMKMSIFSVYNNFCAKTRKKTTKEFYWKVSFKKISKEKKIYMRAQRYNMYICIYKRGIEHFLHLTFSNHLQNEYETWWSFIIQMKISMLSFYDN